MTNGRIVLSRDASSSWRQSRSTPEPWLEKQGYPGFWIHPPGPAQEPAFTLFKLTWRTRKSTRLLLHVSADERYRLDYQGQSIGEGPERGHCHHWKFESYRIEFKPGLHHLSALVWSVGAARPWAQTSIRHGFLLWPEETDAIANLATGVAPWRCRRVTGIELIAADRELGCSPGGGPGFALNTSNSHESAWHRAVKGAPALRAIDRLYPGRNEHALEPAELPPQASTSIRSASVLCVTDRPGRAKWRKIFQPRDRQGDVSVWENLWTHAKALRLAPNRTMEVVWDLGRYTCGRPFVSLDGLKSSQARLEFLVVETPFDQPAGFVEKSRRDSIWSKYFYGIPDRFSPASSMKSLQKFSPLWWRAGRFLVLRIFTGTRGLVVKQLGWKTTGYPLQLAVPEVSPTILQQVLQVSAHTLEMCTHETYVDCPYYEQLMYAGDARIESLITYCCSGDARLPRKALRLFDQSRANARGLPTDAVPGHHKIIPPFALWWISMIHDHARWHGDPGFIRTLLPGARYVADLFLQSVDSGGLAHQLEGWNFYDWCWPGGIPPGGHPGETSALLQWHLILILNQLRELELWCGEAQRAKIWQTARKRLCHAAENFWVRNQQLYADAEECHSFSQHTQSLALLSGGMPSGRRQALLQALRRPSAHVTQAGGYFTHYVFQALLQEKSVDAFLAGLKPWTDALAMGFTTFPETFGSTRSDCHAWNAHPLYHTITGVAGLQPSQLGGRHWSLSPCLGPLQELKVQIPRKDGAIKLELHREGKVWRGELSVPAWASVTFVQGHTRELWRSGLHPIRFRT